VKEKITTILSLLILFFFSVFSFAQGDIEPTNENGYKIQKNHKKEISYYKAFGEEPVYSKEADFFGEVVGVSEDDEFRLYKKGGDTFNEYRQYYKGVPVKSGVYILHRSSGQIKSANGNYIRVGELETEPAVTSDEAMEKWCDYLKIPVDEVRTFKNELMIVDKNEYKESEEQSQPALAYKIRLYTQNLLNTLIGYVDANSGDICLTEPIALTSSGSTARKNLVENNMDIALAAPALLPSSATGTFATRYSSSRSATTELRSGLYYLEDWTRGDGIETLNLENSNAADTTGAVSFSDNDNNWTSDEYNNDDYDNAALDVHWALQEVYDFFENEYSRSGWDSTGQKVNAYVHSLIYDGYSLTKDNSAYYSGEYLAFGDGQSITYPFVSLDVVAHEYAHGINDHTSSFGASGLVRSFNEGLSDIWAAVIENDVAPKKENWKMFEEVMRDYDCDRNLQNPDDSGARTEIADTYGSDEYNSNTGEYYRSGILSHWFYLLSEGGSGTNGIDNEYTVFGLGIESAADLVYHAQAKRYLNGTTTYPLMRTNMVNAANILFGANSIQSLQVENAWYAVGVGSDPGQVAISGPSLVCSSGATFTVDSLPTVDTIIWTTGSSLAVTGGQGTSSCTVSAIGSGSSWVQAELITASDTIVVPQLEVWAGLPEGPTVYPSTLIYQPVNNIFWVYIIESPGDPTETGFWETYGCVSLHGNNTGSSTSFYSWSDNGTGTIYVSTSNACGGNYYRTAVTVITGSGGVCGELPESIEEPKLVISPNPAGSYIDIEIISESDDFDSKAQIKIFNSDSKQVMQVNTESRKTRIELSGLKSGTYIVIAERGSERLYGKFMVLR
jgi:Zn-dependent metalloprotease